LRIISSTCKLRLINLNNTSNIQITLNISLKFLIILEINLRLSRSTNITLELKYWYNNSKSLELLIESLENYFKLLIKDLVLNNFKIKNKRI